jgi:hypothetical protein
VTSEVDEAWAAITEGPRALRAEALRTRLACAADPMAVALACAERLAVADASLRQGFGGVLAVFVAARTPTAEPLDPRIDGALGLVSRAFRLDERIYGRIPPERLGPILVRVLSERPTKDDPAAGHDLIAAIRRAPEATGAFIEYLRVRKELRRLAPRGDLADAFAAARREVPRIDALAAAALPRGETSRGKSHAAPEIPSGPFEIVTIATVRSPRDVEALGAERAAQFLAAARAVVGEKKVASLAAAFATPLRDGEGPLVAVLHEIRDARPRYDLWTFFADTGIVLELGATKTVGVDWIDGSFEASRPALAALAYQLEAAPWRRGAHKRR